MNNIQLSSKFLALIPTFALLFFITACSNNNQTTSSAGDSTNTSVNNDTAMNKAPVSNTGTAMSSTKKQTTTKKGRATLGAMTTSKTALMKPDKNGVYEMTEVRPSYPGGQKALEDYIANDIEYPQMAVDDNKEGTVNVQFIVDENGNVTNAKLLGADLGDGLSDEAVRVISKMPKWEPGKVKGKNVKTRLTLPVTYKIEE
jgi:protein TonB